LIDLIEPPPGHGNGIDRICASYTSSCSATEGIGSAMRHLHKIGCDLPDGLSRLIIDTAVTAQVTGIVIGYHLFANHVKIKILEELGNMKDLDAGIAETFVSAIVIKGPEAVWASGNYLF